MLECVTAGRLSPPLKKKMHVRLSNNTATRETLNGIEGIVSIKRMEHQPTSGGFGWSLAWMLGRSIDLDRVSLIEEEYAR